MSKVYFAAGNTMPYTNTTGVTLASGTVVETDDMHGVVIKDILNTAEGPLKINGIANLPATGTIANAGIALFWDSTNLVCTPTKGAWKRIGTSGAAKDAITTDYIPVILNLISEPGDDPTHLDIKGDVQLATDAALSACTAAGSQIGKTLTADANGVETIDSVTLALNDRVLVKNQVAGKDNGIYLCTQAGAGGAKFILTRAVDADTDDRVTSGMICFAEKGTVHAEHGFILSTDEPFDLDTDALTFTNFNALGMVVAGTGLTKTGDTMNAIGGDGITANADDLALDIKTNGGLSIDTAQVKLDLNDLSAATVDVTADSIGIIDANASNASAKESIDDLVTALAGDGIQNTTSQFAFDASDVAGTGIEADGENLRIAAQGAGIAGGGGTTVSLDLTYGAAWTGAHTFNTTCPSSTQTPSGVNDLVNKAYADALVSGLDLKESVHLATDAALSACTAAGTGVGKTLTADAVGVETIDGVVLALNDRVLVQDQASGLNNGIFLCTTAGAGGAAFVLTRATDADTDAEVNPGMFTFVEEGTVNADHGFVLVTNDPITLDTTALTFTPFSGAGMITAGSGLTKTGHTINAIGGNGITANADDLAVDPDGTTGGNIAAVNVTAHGVGMDMASIDGDGLRASGAELHVDVSDFAGAGLADDGAENLYVTGVPALFEVDSVAVGSNVTASNLDELTSSGETNIHIHDDRYFAESEFLASGAGAGDAGKPIKLDAGGHVDASMINDADVDHNTTGGKDGGTGGEYYHLTLAQHTLALDHKAKIGLASSGNPALTDLTTLTADGDWALASGAGAGAKMWFCSMIGAKKGYVELTAAT